MAASLTGSPFNPDPIPPLDLPSTPVFGSPASANDPTQHALPKPPPPSNEAQAIDAGARTVLGMLQADEKNQPAQSNQPLSGRVHIGEPKAKAERENKAEPAQQKEQVQKDEKQKMAEQYDFYFAHCKVEKNDKNIPLWLKDVKFLHNFVKWNIQFVDVYFQSLIGDPGELALIDDLRQKLITARDALQKIKNDKQVDYAGLNKQIAELEEKLKVVEKRIAELMNSVAFNMELVNGNIEFVADSLQLLTGAPGEIDLMADLRQKLQSAREALKKNQNENQVDFAGLNNRIDELEKQIAQQEESNPTKDLTATMAPPTQENPWVESYSTAARQVKATTYKEFVEKAFTDDILDLPFFESGQHTFISLMQPVSASDHKWAIVKTILKIAAVGGLITGIVIFAGGSAIADVGQGVAHTPLLSSFHVITQAMIPEVAYTAFAVSGTAIWILYKRAGKEDRLPFLQREMVDELDLCYSRYVRSISPVNPKNDPRAKALNEDIEVLEDMSDALKDWDKELNKLVAKGRAANGRELLTHQEKLKLYNLKVKVNKAQKALNNPERIKRLKTAGMDEKLIEKYLAALKVKVDSINRSIQWISNVVVQ